MLSLQLFERCLSASKTQSSIEGSIRAAAIYRRLLRSAESPAKTPPLKNRGRNPAGVVLAKNGWIVQGFHGHIKFVESLVVGSSDSRRVEHAPPLGAISPGRT